MHYLLAKAKANMVKIFFLKIPTHPTYSAVMKVLRQKQIRKTLQWFALSFGLRPPYRIVLDGSFLHAVSSLNIELETMLRKLLMAEVKLFVAPFVLKELQRDPAKGKFLHADFQRVSSKTKLKVIIPVNFVNEEECAGVKLDGGVVAKAIREIEIMCLAGNIPESIDVDIENLNLGDSIRLTEISLPEGSEIPGLTDETDQMVVSVNAPKAVEEDPTVEEDLEDGEAAKGEEASDSGSEETTSSDESSSEENSEES